ncbi:MAG: hypothetical protein ABGW66_01875, partial [Flavobacteriaceae bacterium]
MNFKTSDTTTFMFIVGTLFIIGGFVQFVDWIDIGIGTVILLIAFAIDMRKTINNTLYKLQIYPHSGLLKPNN